MNKNDINIDLSKPHNESKWWTILVEICSHQSQLIKQQHKQIVELKRELNNLKN